MNLQKITLRNVVASGQPRPLVTSEVDRLSASIRSIGLIQPVTVRESVVVHGTAEKGWQIVAGHHRVAACRALGWTEIDALVIEDAGHLQSELIEIDENLCRAELTASQRTKYTARRKQIWEAMNPETKPDTGGQSLPTCLSDGRKAGPQHEQGFAAETAAATGQSKSSINQSLAVSNVLGGNTLDRVSGTSLDKGVELIALTKLTPDAREALIVRAEAGEKVSARLTEPEKPSKKPAQENAAIYFASEVNSLLQRVAEKYQCASKDDAALEVAKAVDALSETQFAWYMERIHALDDFLGLAESVVAGDT